MSSSAPCIVCGVPDCAPHGFAGPAEDDLTFHEWADPPGTVRAERRRGGVPMAAQNVTMASSVYDEVEVGTPRAPRKSRRLVARKGQVMSKVQAERLGVEGYTVESALAELDQLPPQADDAARAAHERAKAERLAGCPDRVVVTHGDEPEPEPEPTEVRVPAPAAEGPAPEPTSDDAGEPEAIPGDPLEAELAAVPEGATFPWHKGGGWYVLSSGDVAKGDDATEAQAELGAMVMGPEGPEPDDEPTGPDEGEGTGPDEQPTTGPSKRKGSNPDS